MEEREEQEDGEEKQKEEQEEQGERAERGGGTGEGAKVRAGGQALAEGSKGLFEAVWEVGSWRSRVQHSLVKNQRQQRRKRPSPSGRDPQAGTGQARVSRRRWRQFHV